MITVFEKQDSAQIKSSTVFILLFTATLAASIFLNQIGYYGALIMLLAGWYKTKENPFRLTGVETGFALYIIAILVSAVFSGNSAEAFHNLLKRTLLIPTVYTLAAAASTEFKFKLFYKSIIGFTSVIGIIYLYFAFNSYITHELQRTGSGPAVFQHPITTSQMFTYAFILCAGLLLGTKKLTKDKLVYVLSALILGAALLATYKRTGWLGCAVGILFIIFLSRKWLIAFLFVLLLGIVVYLQPNTSTIYVFDQNKQGKAEQLIATEGRVGTPVSIDSLTVITDFDKGLLYFDRNFSLLKKQNLSNAISNLYKLNDTLYGAYYFDLSMQRLIYKNGSFTPLGEPFLAPGDTKHCTVVGERVYFLDNDSGLTVYTNVAGGLIKKRFPKYNDYSYFSVDSSYIVFYEAGARTLLCELNSAGFPVGERVNLPFDPKKISMALVYRYNFIRVTGNDIDIYDCRKLPMTKTASFTAKGILGVQAEGDSILFTTVSGILSYNLKTKKRSLFAVENIAFEQNYYTAHAGNKIVITNVNRGRLLGFVDSYNPSNNNRMSFWRAAILIYRDYPLFGVGDIDVANYYIKYKRPTDKEV
ncbi:MAG: O-antigen ligase family protein, partial [Ignavibacteriales bacterium]|nr:O-antigen ligase family protein [Ignavibacteriales bacterium]